MKEVTSNSKQRRVPNIPITPLILILQECHLIGRKKKKIGDSVEEGKNQGNDKASRIVESHYKFTSSNILSKYTPTPQLS